MVSATSAHHATSTSVACEHETLTDSEVEWGLIRGGNTIASGCQLSTSIQESEVAPSYRGSEEYWYRSYDPVTAELTAYRVDRGIAALLVRLRKYLSKVKEVSERPWYVQRWTPWMRTRADRCSNTIHLQPHRSSTGACNPVGPGSRLTTLSQALLQSEHQRLGAPRRPASPLITCRDLTRRGRVMTRLKPEALPCYAWVYGMMIQSNERENACML